MSLKMQINIATGAKFFDSMSISKRNDKAMITVGFESRISLHSKKDF